MVGPTEVGRLERGGPRGMADVYFIAAGKSSKNRAKSLDRGFRVDELAPYLEPDSQNQLRNLFAGDEVVYAWGANKAGQLNRFSPGDYIVDVKNKDVVQVFRFAFYFETTGAMLQDWIGWDAEKPISERRPYQFVYFLRAPQGTSRKEKSYFQRAFQLESNQNWLVGQRWFGGSQLEHAMQRTNSDSLEEFLGIEAISNPTIPTDDIPIPPANIERQAVIYLRPGWLTPVIEQVEELRRDKKHMERQHEDAVAHLFQVLGYQRGSEIKFRMGRVDIQIVEHGQTKPSHVVEVKRDWALSCESKEYVRQAHNYALETGSRWVILTNGDDYILYDRTKGLSYDEQFVSQFTITKLTPDGLNVLSKLSRTSL
mgnify:FL=1